MPAKAPAQKRETVLIFAYYYAPENASGAARPGRFVKFLPEFGYEPRVISGGDRAEGWRSSGCVTRVPDGSESMAARAAGRAGRLLQRVLLPYEEHLPWIPHGAETGCRMAAALPVAAIISTSPPIATHVAALRVKKRYGTRWIADFRDPMAGNPFRRSRRSRLYDPVLERAIFRHADAVIANTATVADVWRGRYPRWRDKIHVLWNGFDPEEKLPAPRSRETGPVVLAHVGGLYAERHPGVLLSSLDRLIGSGLVNPEELRLRQVGGMERIELPMDQPPFRTFVERGWLECTNHLPREEAAQAAADADFLLLLDLNRMNTGLQVPAKLFEYIRLGKPVLAFTPRASAVEYILAGSGVPYRCVYPSDAEPEVDGKVLSFLQFPRRSASPSEWFLQEFDARRQTAALCRLIDPRGGVPGIPEETAIQSSR